MTEETPGVGHNSDGAEAGIAGEELKSFVERIQRLDEEKKALTEDIRDVFAEAKGRGFDVKVLRKILRDLKTDRADREAFESIYAVYAKAIGMDFMV